MAELDEKLERIITAKDQVIPSPEERAKVVLGILKTHAPDLTEWDLVCFATNYLGYISGRYMWMQKEAIGMASLVYHAHYLVEEDLPTGLRKKDDSLRDQLGSPPQGYQSEGSPSHFDFSLHVPDCEGIEGEAGSAEEYSKPLSSDN